MELFTIILIILALIGVSNVLNHLLPFIPVPLIQIVLGIAIPLVYANVQLHEDPGLFFLLFIAPLLYNDGKHTPRNELWRLRAPILFLAVGLVFVTVFALGYAIHWIIPSIPLPVAFGLAAILSPTDSVAVGSLTDRIRLPQRLAGILEGESLMNDAAGLVAFKFAIAAAVTGTFSLAKASISFPVVFIGGLAVGLAAGALIAVLHVRLRRSGLEQETLHLLIDILTPFALYTIGEALGVSGILAAVAGGVVYTVEREYIRKIKSRSGELSNYTWTTIVYLLNGLVFVILGLQLPGVFRVILQDSVVTLLIDIALAAAVYIVLIALRLLWIHLYFRFSKKEKKSEMSFRLLLISSLSGVRGAVTLAGAFTIPLLLDSGEPFPQRNLVIFIAAFVILLSLLVASIALPLIGRNKEMDREAADKERESQLQIMQAAIRAVRQATGEENREAAAAVISQYEQWIQEARLEGQRQPDWQGAALRLEAMDIERRLIQQLLETYQISRHHADALLENLADMERVLSRQMWPLFPLLRRVIRRARRFWHAKRSDNGTSPHTAALRDIKLQTSRAVIEEFEKKLAAVYQREVAEVIERYRFVVRLLAASWASSASEQLQRDLQWIAIQAERDEAQSLYMRNEITRDTANRLRQAVRDREALILESELK